MSRILVVDDKEMMRDSVSTTLVRKGHAVSTAASGTTAVTRLTERQFDAVVTDLQMPGMDGLALLQEIRQLDEQLPVILMTAYGTVESAVEAMKHGAYDYITKPFSGDELVVAVERAIERSTLMRENQILRAAADSGGRSTKEAAHEMIGEGPIMQSLRQKLEKLSDSHGTVLVSGESGSGKEVAAKFIHAHSPRASRPFLALNCAALSTNLLESELFGHEKGAFTGADKLRKGRFELADGGTLLLDEISEIAPEIQAKLLRVLQERVFERVGSSTSRAVDVRVIATTNRDLAAEVAQGRFREDLYFRLNVLPVRMPALRERPEDVPALTVHFLEQVAQREGKNVKRMSEACLSMLQDYHWPGNVRELQNVCERAAVLTNHDMISDDLIRPWLSLPQTADDGTFGKARRLVKPGAMIEVTAAPSDPVPNTIEQIRLICDGERTLEDIERETIVATLKHHNGHRQKSAAALGIGVRTLGLKLKKWKELSLVESAL